MTDAPVTHTRCRCAGCGEVFSGLTAFDKHRRAGSCLHPADIGLEMKVGPRGSWWGFPGGDFRPRKGQVVSTYRVARKTGVAAQG